MSRSRIGLLAMLSLWVAGLDAPAAGPPPPLLLRVEAGRHDRERTPVRVDLPLDAVTTPLAPSAREGLLQPVEGDGPPLRVEVERTAGPEPKLRLTWVQSSPMPAGSHRLYRLQPTSESRAPWSLAERPDGTLELKNDQRTVFRYNVKPTSHPNYGPIQRRSAYIHPAFTPGGALITGDYSRAHAHHRGFFLAYTKTKIGSLAPDFWNIQAGSGKIHCDRLGPTSVGPVTARFTAHHRWEARGLGVVLRERWDVEAFDVPGQPYWLFDLTSTQQATESPIELPPYRYGGMAYRGPDPFLPFNKLDVLTSEGLDRRRGDQKPARWVDLTGPIEEGSSQYAGAMIADHPGNIHHPTVARIHPTTLPFFSFVPSHDQKVVIGTDEPLVFRYRILIHDGRPDRERAERVWRDFAEPPTVVVVGAAP